MEQFQKIYLYKRIVQAKVFIDDHYAEEIDTENIADQACFSTFHFIRLFKNVYGKTPHHYLTKVRIDKAKILLTSGISISAVCYLVGFNSVTSFTGLFKKIVGLTPSSYQLKQQQLTAKVNSQPLQFVPNCFAETYGWAQNSNFKEVPL